MSDPTEQTASISPDSRIDAGTLIKGPVRFGRWASAEDHAIAVGTAEGRCSIVGTALSGGRVEDVRAVDSVLAYGTARRSALNGVSATGCDLYQSKIRGRPDDEGCSQLRLEDSTIRRSDVQHDGTRALQVTASVLAEVHLKGSGEFRDSALLGATVSGHTSMCDCFAAPAHHRPDDTQTTIGRGANLNRVLDMLGARPTPFDPAWPADVEYAHSASFRRPPHIADSTITSSWITGSVTGSRIDTSRIDGTVADSRVVDSHIGLSGTVRDGAEVTGSTIHGTVAGGSVDGATVPHGALVADDAEILADSHIAVAEVDGTVLTAYRTAAEHVSVVDQSGRPVPTPHRGPVADLVAGVSHGLDPLVDTSIYLDPGPDNQPLLP